MKVFQTKRFVSITFIGLAFALIAAGCSHSSEEETINTQTPATLAPRVVSNPTSTTTQQTEQPGQTTTTEAGADTTLTTSRPTRSGTPTEPQVELTTRYILSANPRAPDAQGIISTQAIRVYDSENGNLITEEIVLDPETGEPLLDPETGEPQTRCLLDFSTTCLPTDPTSWGARLTFLVIQGAPGDGWAEVLLATRPNNTTGWVRTEGFEWTTHNFHIIIDVSERTVSVWQGTQNDLGNRKLLIHSKSILGKASSPTPVVATTYIEAKIFNDSRFKDEGGFGVQYGTWIFPLAAFSDTLTEFQGGSPRLAIHGTNIPDSIGQALSSGCIRLPNPVIDQLAAMIPLGTPVSIIA